MPKDVTMIAPSNESPSDAYNTSRSFLSLPAEVRNNVYDFAIWPLLEYRWHELRESPGGATWRTLSALVRTCRQINHEVISFYYGGDRRFIVDVDDFSEGQLFAHTNSFGTPLQALVFARNLELFTNINYKDCYLKDCGLSKLMKFLAQRCSNLKYLCIYIETPQVPVNSPDSRPCRAGSVFKELRNDPELLDAICAISVRKELTIDIEKDNDSRRVYDMRQFVHKVAARKGWNIEEDIVRDPPSSVCPVGHLEPEDQEENFDQHGEDGTGFSVEVFYAASWSLTPKPPP